MRAAILAGLMVCMLLPSVQAAGLQRARPESVGLSSERLQRLDRTFQAYVDEGRLGGAVLLVARRGRIAWLHALGYQDIDAGVPMAEDSLFQIWSMTKPITSVALLTLLEEGRFQLTDPVARHIPAFAGLKVLDHVDDAGRPVLVDQERPMTVQDLFRHTSGLSYGLGDGFVDKAYRDASRCSSPSRWKNWCGRWLRRRSISSPAAGGSTASRTTCRHTWSSASPACALTGSSRSVCSSRWA
jgi:CubicO group peptidase (beta-lactamase class C family)